MYLSVITDMLEGVTAWLTGLVALVADSVESFVAVFYDATANSGAGALTIVGSIAMIGLGFVFLNLGIGFVRGIIKA